MHELGIATSILEAVQKEAATRPQTRFVKVVVRIGELAGVDFESLNFGWEAITRDTEWDSLKLDVEAKDWVNRCGKCEHEFRVRDYQTACPKCGDPATKLISGDELDIAFIEVEELAPAAAGGGTNVADPS